MPPIPPCHSLGSQCHALGVTLRAATAEGARATTDHEATWLLGHTERIDFGSPRWVGPELLVDAVLHATCRHLSEEKGEVRCRAHGFAGPPGAARARAPQPLRLERDRFTVQAEGERATLMLPSPPRSLPVISSDNPCATADCSTADHRRGAACCRDLQIEILCPRENTQLDLLVRARRSPYLCKITRPDDQTLTAELISACGYLEENGRDCSLHGRLRPDGRPAKPDLCSQWPEVGDVYHSGCVFRPVSQPAVG